MQPPSEQVIYKFSDFRLDPTRRLLTRNGETVVLHPKAFDLLLTLIEERDRVLTKDELLDRVWNGQFVEENNLAVQVSALRKVFGEDRKDHRFIVTVPGKGYRFVADVLNGDNGNGVPRTFNIGNDKGLAIASNVALPSPAEEAGRRPLVQHPSRQSRWPAKLIAAAGVCAAVIFGLGTYLALRDRPYFATRSSTATNKHLSMRQLTTKGRVGLIAVSPNNEFYVYTIDLVGELKRGLWIAQLNGSKEIEIRPPDDNLIRGAAFSPDGETIYFSLADSDDAPGGFFRIPVLGGVEKRLSDSPRGAFELSPDGKQVAYFKKSAGGGSALVVANLDGTGEREVVVRAADREFRSRTPAWSADGMMLAAGAIVDPKSEVEEICIVRVTDGATQQLTSLNWKMIQGLVWQPDGNGLIAVAIDNSESLRHLWGIEYPGGEASRLTSDTLDYGSPLSISKDGKSLIAVQLSKESNIWIGPSGDLSKARQISFSSLNGGYGWSGLEWTPDARIVFDGGIDRNRAIFIMDTTNGAVTQITSDGSLDRQPTLSPDGRVVVFCSDRSGRNELWRVSIDGGDLRRLTDGRGCSSPDVTPDGSTIVFVSNSDGNGTLWSIPFSGGEAAQLSRYPGFDPKISPDGKSLACGLQLNDNEPAKLAVLDLSTKDVVRTFDMPRSVNFNGGINWTPDSRAITIRDWANGIWRQEAAGGVPTRLKGLPQEKLFGYAWSLDGKTFAFARGRTIADAVVISLQEN